MKTSIKIFALSSLLTLTSAAFAVDGPLLSTLVPLDENKYDMINKQFVEASDVLNRLTKEAYMREVYMVKEKQIPAPTKFVVQENRDQSPYVIVNPQAVNNKWVYQNR